MLNIINQVLLFIFFLSFALGLCSSASLLSGMYWHLHAPRKKRSEEEKTSEGIILFVVTVSYCLLCNAVLIIPSLLQFLGISGDWQASLHLVAVACCVGITALLVGIGILSLNRGLGMRLFSGKPFPFPPPSRNAMACLAVSAGIFLVLAQQNAISYDLGLYHLPYINHLVAYGPELGLANLHARFGFYNVQLFGQTSFQTLTGHPGMLSPSLNIIFFAAFLLHFINAILDDSSFGLGDRIRPLLLFIASLVFGFSSFGSLAGFDADYSLAASSLLVIDWVYRSKNRQHRIQGLLVAGLLPLIKFAGVLTLLTLICFLLLEKVLATVFARPARLESSLGTRGGLNDVAPSFPTLWGTASIPLGFLLAAWLCFATTGVLQSGYPFFPNSAFGPIGVHAVSKAGTLDLLERFVKDYARFNDQVPFQKPHATGERTPQSLWLKAFLRSGRGQQFIAWASAALFASLAGLSGLLLGAKSRGAADPLLRLTALSLSTTTMVVVALLLLPPNPRFFSWLGALAFFLALDCLRRRSLLALLGATLLSAAMALRGQKAMLVNVGEPPSKTWTHVRGGLHGWRQRQPGETITIHQPLKGDQCWSIPAPCSPFKAGLQDGDATDLLR